MYGLIIQSYALEDRHSVDQLRLTLKENDRGEKAMHQDLRCRRTHQIILQIRSRNQDLAGDSC